VQLYLLYARAYKESETRMQMQTQNSETKLFSHVEGHSMSVLLGYQMPITICHTRLLAASF
jgi:hypothetical protein